MSFQYEDIDPKNGELEELFYNIFTKRLGNKFVKAGNDKVILPYDYLKIADVIENMEIYDDDIWLVSFPRTGSSWTHEMLWCILNGMDLERAKQTNFYGKLNHLEGASINPLRKNKPEEVGIYNFSNLNVTPQAINQPHPRFIRTHLQWSMLPKQIRTGEKKPRIIYIARNAKDTCVSYFHMQCLVYGYEDSFDTFSKLFMSNKLMFQPFWNHVIEFWNRREDENILFLKYEDMKKDLSSVIRNVAAFLKKDLTDDQVVSLTDHLSFEHMRSNPALNYEEYIETVKRLKNIKYSGRFIRSGQVGGWKQEMSKEMAEQFDEWTIEHLKNTGLVLEESENVSNKNVS